MDNLTCKHINRLYKSLRALVSFHRLRRELIMLRCVPDNSAGQYNVIQSYTLTCYVFAYFLYLSPYLRASISLSLCCRIIFARRRTTSLNMDVLLVPTVRLHVSPFTGHFIFLSQSTCYCVLKTRRNTKIFFIYNKPFSIGKKKLHEKQVINRFLYPLDLFHSI
jgi:hypothetical protein